MVMVKCIAIQYSLSFYEIIMIQAVARSRATLKGVRCILTAIQTLTAIRTLQRQNTTVVIRQERTMCVKSLSVQLILTQCSCCSLQVELGLKSASLPAVCPGTSWLLAKGFMGCLCLLTNSHCEADCADDVMLMLT